MQVLPSVDNFLSQLMLDRNSLAPPWRGEAAEGKEELTDEGMAALALMWAMIFQQQVLPLDSDAASSAGHSDGLAEEGPAEETQIDPNGRSAVLPGSMMRPMDFYRGKVAPEPFAPLPASPMEERTEQAPSSSNEADSEVVRPEALPPGPQDSPDMRQATPAPGGVDQRVLRNDLSSRESALVRQERTLALEPNTVANPQQMEESHLAEPVAKTIHETVVHFENRVHSRIMNRPTQVVPPARLIVEEPAKSIEQESRKDYEVAQVARGAELETSSTSDAVEQPEGPRFESEPEIPPELPAASAEGNVRQANPAAVPTQIDHEQPVAAASLTTRPDSIPAQAEPDRPEKARLTQWTPPDVPAKPPAQETRTISIRIPLAEAGTQRQHIDLVLHQRNQTLSLHLQSPTPHLQRQMEESMPALLDKLRGEDWVPKRTDPSPGAATPAETLLRSARIETVVPTPLAVELRREQAVTPNEAQNSQDSHESPAGRKDAQEQNHQRRDRKKESVWNFEFEEQFGV